MKNNSLALFAFILAICFVSFAAFTSSEAILVDKYAVHISGDQDEFENYSIIADPSSEPCQGDTRLCLFRVPDTNNDGSISEDEFDARFDALDTDNDLTLDDELEVTGTLEKKS